MKNTIGIGTGKLDVAIQQATKDIHNPSCIIFMGTYDGCEETSKRLMEMYPEAQIIGTIGTGDALGVSHTVDFLHVLALYDDVKVACGVIENVSVCPISHVGVLEEKLTQIQASEKDTVLIEFTNSNEEILVSSLNASLSKRKIQLIGGSVYPIPEGKTPIVAYNGKVYADACVYAVIKNLTGRIKVFKEDIYKKGERKPHYATKVNTATRTICELDGMRAATVYSKEVGIPEKEIINNIFNNPFGRVVGDKVYGSALKDVGPNGEINCYKKINKNDCVYILDLDDYDDIEAKTREMIKNEFPKMSLFFTVDCGYRFFMYSDMKYWDKYVKNLATVGQHFGVVAGGEQCNNQHVNHTMVCAVFE